MATAPRPRPAAYPIGAELPVDTLVYGPDAPTEDELRLLGDVSGKRILQLGTHDGTATVALARRGARVVAVEPSGAHVEAARWRFEHEHVAVELHHGDPADLASVRADSIDAAVSIYTLAGVEDLGRVFRQVHRVLRPESPLVVSLPHPAYALLDPGGDEPLRVRRAYWDASPRPWSVEGHEGVDHTHTVAQLFTMLSRANFRVDTVLEPEPAAQGPRGPYWSDAMRWLPSTLILRARKQGL